MGIGFQKSSDFPLQEVTVRAVSDSYTLYSGWLHPLDVMATPFAIKGVALRKRCFYPQENGLQFFHIYI